MAPGVQASEMGEGLRDRGRGPPGPAAPAGQASAERCWSHREEVTLSSVTSWGRRCPGCRVSVLTHRKPPGN